MKQGISTFPLRLPISLKNAVAEFSQEDNTSINQFVVVAVAEKLSAMKTAEFFAERRGRADPKAAMAILSREGGQPPEPEDRLREESESQRRPD
jgi:hypothetical protein